LLAAPSCADVVPQRRVRPERGGVAILPKPPKIFRRGAEVSNARLICSPQADLSAPTPFNVTRKTLEKGEK